MRRVLVVTAGLLPACATHRPPADLLLINANVHTLDAGRPRAEAIAIRGDRIVFVGSSTDARALQGSATVVRDLAGATVVPGLADAHYHLGGVGEREMTLNLEGTDTKAAFLARVQERVAQTPAGEWVIGSGWIETFWVPQAFPTRQDLDRIAPDHPVVLTRADGHASVLNSKALAVAQVTRTTPDPKGGSILRDASGEATGMLIDWAQGLIAVHMPKDSPAKRDSMLVVGARRSTELGWTQVQNAGGSWDEVGRLRRLYASGTMKLRVYQAIGGPGKESDSLLAVGPSVGEFGGRLTIRTIKTFVDGALGSRGALLLAPYSDEPAAKGLMTGDTAKLRPMLAAALAKGVQVEAHAIGDSANRLILNLYDAAFRTVAPAQRAGASRDLRWRIEHAQIIDPADIPRFKSLGVIPSMQPSHAIGDLYFADKRLGVPRLSGAYAWKSFIDQGVPVAGGSDAPVERGEPMIEFYAAVARRDIRGKAGDDAVWHPEQRVSRTEALRMFTTYAAHAAFEERVRGSITVGKWADLTVLDRDIMSIPDAEILLTRAVMTLIAGEIVFERKR
ncbi:MAG: amidohydrolase [Gemmatimonadaceae bacterium]|nr:amidohydrolase [Gemmatimonadaceae bacterium]